MTDISGTLPSPLMILMDLITLAEKRGFKEMEDGLPQPPPGAGAGLVVSLLPKPDIYLEQETRVHETESSWGWTYGNENANNCCCFIVFFCVNLNLLFVVGPENQSGNNFTPQTTFRPYITHIVPSHPGGSGVECTIKLWDARYLIFLFNLLSSFSSGTWRLFSLWTLWCPSRGVATAVRAVQRGNLHCGGRGEEGEQNPRTKHF